MAQSKKFKETDTYFDTTGIWDTGMQKSLSDVLIPVAGSGTPYNIGIYCVQATLSSTAKVITITANATNRGLTGLLFSRYGIQTVAVRCGQTTDITHATINAIHGDASNLPTIAASGNVCTITIPAWYYGTLLYTQSAAGGFTIEG